MHRWGLPHVCTDERFPAEVGAESRLPVGPRWHEVVPSAPAEEKRAETDYQIPALILSAGVFAFTARIASLDNGTQSRTANQ